MYNYLYIIIYILSIFLIFSEYLLSATLLRVLTLIFPGVILGYIEVKVLSDFPWG